MDSKELVTQLRDALAHLYDPAHLQSHPLADALVEAETLGSMTRAQKLRRILLEALEQLSPPDQRTPTAEDSAAYQALHYRYLDGLSVEEIGAILAMSPRQIYRKLREGVEALASLLNDQLLLEQGTAPVGKRHAPQNQDRRTLAQAALQQLENHAQAEVIEVNELLETIVRDLRPYCQQIGALIQLHLLPRATYTHADRTMLRQGLLNLLTSGLDRVAVAATGTILQITVAATATEIQLSFALNRAEPVELTAAATTAAPTATADSVSKREGIGLEVAIQLFQMQRIQIDHRQELGCWRVALRMPAMGTAQILVIDDMPDIPPLFQRFTTAHAVEVLGAANGEEALAWLRQTTPALILLDVMLPRRDGWEILQTLKANPETAAIPVIICSILNEPGLAAALGADGYLPKPVSQEALLQLLSRWLQLTPTPAAVQS